MESHQEIEMPADTIAAYEKTKRKLGQKKRAETFSMHLLKVFKPNLVKLL